jgi:hypothetical protein
MGGVTKKIYLFGVPWQTLKKVQLKVATTCSEKVATLGAGAEGVLE